MVSLTSHNIKTYGVRDINTYNFRSEQNKEIIRKHLQGLITHYESRLTHIEVQSEENNNADIAWQFHIYAGVHSSTDDIAIHLQTEFYRDQQHFHTREAL